MSQRSPTTLRDRFLRLGLLIAVVKLVAVVTLVWTSIRLSEATGRMLDARECVVVTNRARGHLSRVRRNMLAYRLTDDTTYLKEAHSFEEALTREPIAAACSDTPQFVALIADLPRLLDDYFVAEEDAMTLDPGESRSEAEAEVRRKFQAAGTALAELDFLSNERNAAASAEADEVQQALQDVGTVVGIGSIVLVASLLIVLRRDLVLPMSRLTAGIREMRRSGQIGGKLGLGLQAELGEIERAVDELSQLVAEQRAAQYRFIAAVAHDLRNPLQSIRAYSSFVRDGKALPSEAVLRKGFAIIDKQTQRLSRQLEDLLDAARIQAGALQINKDDVDLSALVEEVRGLHEVVSDKHRIEVLVPESLHVYGDSTRLGQVLTNLVTNAVKYSPAGGNIRIALTRNGDEARIAITDEGIGIDREQLKRLFEPFYRLATTKDIPGVGLGLATSRWIVEAHGGHIEVESEVGRGTTFTVCLPIARTEQPAEDVRPQDEHGSHSTSDPPPH